MDAYFASVEQLDHPEYRNKPIAVGGSKKGGVVAAASYEARKFGVHSALPSVIAVRRCPDLIFVTPRFERYRQLSTVIRQVLYEFTELVEPLSLDEAYLDVTYNKKEISSAIKIAQLIRQKIKNEVGLTASAGVSFNKFLAKTASDLDKPDGLSVILPEQAEAFLKQLSIDQFHGIGAKTAKKMHQKGIRTGEDLLKASEAELVGSFGKAGAHFYRMVRAKDDRAVKPNRIRKSIGAERTFLPPLREYAALVEQLRKVHQSLVQRIEQQDRSGKTITLKWKYSDFEIKSRSKSLPKSTKNSEVIWDIAIQLLAVSLQKKKPVRLLGISISNLDLPQEQKDGQLTLSF